MIRLVESTTWPPEGPVRVYQEPLSGHGYVIGADVAEGLEHGDFSCGQVLDTETGMLVATWHDRTDADLFGEQLAVLGRYYHTALIGVEINSIGHVTVTSLRKLNYPRLFRRRVVGQMTEGFAPQYGWRTDKLSKPKMIEGLGAALRDGTIDIRDEYTLAELRTYIREYTTAGTVKMHGSPHDDRVMALAVAVQMLDYTFMDAEEERKTDYWSMDWWKRKIVEYNSESEEIQPLGQLGVRVHGT